MCETAGNHAVQTLVSRVPNHSLVSHTTILLDPTIVAHRRGPPSGRHRGAPPLGQTVRKTLPDPDSRHNGHLLRSQGHLVPEPAADLRMAVSRMSE